MTHVYRCRIVHSLGMLLAGPRIPFFRFECHVARLGVSGARARQKSLMQDVLQDDTRALRPVPGLDSPA